MDVNQIKERIAKKEVQIAKIKKRIDKWESAKSEAYYVKDNAPYYTDQPKKVKTMDQLIDLRKKFDPSGNAKKWVEDHYKSHIKYCDDEIRYAKRDLEEAEAQLEKYKSQLGDKENKNNTEKIPAIVEFLDNWKKDAKEYVMNNLVWLNKYYEASREASNFYNNEMWKMEDKKEAREIYNRMKEEAKDLSFFIHPYTYESRKLLKDGTYTIDDDKLGPILDKDAEAKYWDMVARVEKITGKITNAEGLRIGQKGNLNGYITGEDGKCHLDTIVAGGQNAGRIVNVKKGPIAHYRIICNRVK